MMFFLGNYTVKSRASVPAALEALKNRPLYAEKWASFRMVCSVEPVLWTTRGLFLTLHNLGTGCHGCQD